MKLKSPKLPSTFRVPFWHFSGASNAFASSTVSKVYRKMLLIAVRRRLMMKICTLFRHDFAFASSSLFSACGVVQWIASRKHKSAACHINFGHSVIKHPVDILTHSFDNFAFDVCFPRRLFFMSCENRAGKKRKSVDNAENSPTKVSKMSKNQSKTPVMILQEICAKKVKFHNTNLQFQLVSHRRCLILESKRLARVHRGNRDAEWVFQPKYEVFHQMPSIESRIGWRWRHEENCQTHSCREASAKMLWEQDWRRWWRWDAQSTDTGYQQC